MPVTWSICHEDRIVLADAQGDVTVEEVHQYLSAVAAAGGMPYRKVFNTTYALPGALRFAELRALSKGVVDIAKGGPIGPIAIVVGSELEHELAEMYGETRAGRALAIFSDVAKARQWLDQLGRDEPTAFGGVPA